MIRKIMVLVVLITSFALAGCNKPVACDDPEVIAELDKIYEKDKWVILSARLLVIRMNGYLNSMESITREYTEDPLKGIKYLADVSMKKRSYKDWGVFWKNDRDIAGQKIKHELYSESPHLLLSSKKGEPATLSDGVFGNVCEMTYYYKRADYSALNTESASSHRERRIKYKTKPRPKSGEGKAFEVIESSLERETEGFPESALDYPERLK